MIDFLNSIFQILTTGFHGVGRRVSPPRALLFRKVCFVRFGGTKKLANFSSGFLGFSVSFYLMVSIFKYTKEENLQNLKGTLILEACRFFINSMTRTT